MSDRALIRWLLGLGVIIVVLALVGVSQSWQPEHSEKIQHEIPTYTCNNCKIEIKQEKGFFKNLLSDPVAFFTAVLAFLTFVLSGVGAAQVYFLRRTDESTRKSADAAKEAADVARDALIASNRAWIEADVRIDKVQSFQSTSESAVCFIQIKVRNRGNAPAFNIETFVWLIPARPPGVASDWMTKHRSFCDDARKRRNWIGEFLYPDESYPSERHPTGYITFQASVGAEILREHFPAFADGATPAQFYVGGCVNYSFGTDDRRHQTSFIYWLRRVGGQEHYFANETISQEWIWLETPFFSSSRLAD